MTTHEQAVVTGDPQVDRSYPHTPLTTTPPDSTHECDDSLCDDSIGEHNDPCDDPPYPDGCRLEIVRPGKVQCECDNLPECDECGCPEHAAVCNGFGWDQHLAVAIPCDCNNRKDNQ